MLGDRAEGWTCWERPAGVGDADGCLVLVGELRDADDVCGIELDVVVDLDPDVLAGVEEPLGGPAAGAADEGVLADGRTKLCNALLKSQLSWTIRFS